MAQYELNLRDYWRIVKKRRWIILGMAVLVSTLTFFFSTLRSFTPIYKATAIVKYERAGTVTALLQPVVSHTPLSVLIAAQVGMVQAFPVIARAAKMLGYLPEDLDSTQIKASPEYLNVVLGLKQQIQAEQDKETGLIRITATANDPKMTAQLANTVAEAYRQENILSVNKQVIEAKAFVEEQLRQVGSRLKEAEAVYQAAREQMGHVFFQDEAKAALSSRFQLEEQYKQVKRRIALTRAQIQKLEGALSSDETVEGKPLEDQPPPSGPIVSKEEPSREGLSEDQEITRFFSEEGGGSITTLNALNIRLLDLLSQRADLLIYYKPDHPQLLELGQRVQNVRKEMILELNLRLQSSQEREAYLRDQIERSREDYLKVPRTMLELARLERDVELNDKLFTLLKSRHQEILIKEAEQIEEVALLDPAVVPTAPINAPNTALNAFVGLFIGLLAGGVIAFARESLDTSLGTIEEVEALLKVPVLGVIPRMEPGDLKAYVPYSLIPPGGQGRIEPYLYLVTLFAPKSNGAESYRTLRAHFQLTCMDKNIRTLMFTSVALQEGKSTVAVNLAISLAQNGKRVLLLDADLRKPSVHAMFGIEKEPGLTEILSGHRPWRQTIKTATDLALGGLRIEELQAFFGLDHLHVITAGTLSSAPSELLNTERMKELLSELRAQYDVVLLDVPPILPIADALILGALVDGTLIVYEVGRVASGALKRVKNLLDNVEAKTIGIVLNNVTAEVSPDYLRYGYYNYPLKGPLGKGPLKR